MRINKQRIQMLFTALLVIFFTNTTFSQSIERNVLYTLGEKEEIVVNHYASGSGTKFSFQDDSVKYSCLIKRKEANADKHMTLVVNGKTILTATEILPVWFDYYDINIFDVEKSKLLYTKGNEYFAKYKGKEYGPFEHARFPVSSSFGNEDANNVIEYSQMGQSLLILPDGRTIQKPETVKGDNEDGIQVIFIPNSNNYFLIITAKYWSSSKNRHKIYYNTKYLTETTGQNVYPQLYYNKNGDWLASFGEDVFLNGKNIGNHKGWNNVFGFTNSKKYIIEYGNENETYLDISGEKKFHLNKNDRLWDAQINENGEYIFRYSKDYWTEEGYSKDYIIVNGKTITYNYFPVGTIDGAEQIIANGVDDLGHFTQTIINDKGDYIYAYYTNNKFHVAINERSEGPYDMVWPPYLDEKGNYAYLCMTGTKQHIVKNGKISDAFDKCSEPTINNGHCIYAYAKQNKFYVSIDGQIEGPYDFMPYDFWGEVKLAPLYYLNEKGQYAYTYENEGIQYACINGKVYKAPFDGERNEQPVSVLSGGGRILTGGGFYFKEDSKNGFDAEYHYEENNLIVDLDGKVISISPVIDDKSGTFIAKNEKDNMIFNKNYPYVLINNQKYGNGKILAAGYNQFLNVFRWAVLENQELVVYEYKIEK
ncbi:MAG: hypothetical protein LBQ22_12960 [Bacteroidales bacterium]|jgi:hypothetical protein|nr:hypothetical protein [Bacteroidales bacterium]